MKKIFYILASAIVALGAVACENEALDNVNPDNNVKGEGLTITATIDEATKVAFDGLTPSWEEGDKLVIGEYEFTFTEGNKFTCEKEGVYSLCDGTEKEITAGEFNSSNGLAGSFWVANSVIARENTNVTLELVTAVLKVTAAADNTVLKSTMFSNDGEDVALPKGVETYVPIWRGDNTTVTYFVDGIECKSLTKNFEAGKVYTLGTLAAPAKVWLLGDWDSWAEPLRMFVENDYYVAKNVVIGANEKFKFNDGSLYLGGNSTKDAWNTFGGDDIKLGAGTYDIYVAAKNGAWCAVTAGSDVPALSSRYVYLKPGSNWEEASAKFHAWCWGGSSADSWVSFTWAMYENNANYYVADFKDYTGCKIIRQDPNASAGWSNWGDSGDQNNINTLCTITGWASSVKWTSLIP